MTVTVKGWQDFLDSLSTKGGNIFLMFLALIGLMSFVHHLGTDGHVDASILSASHDMMVGFGAALLAVLSGSSSRQQMADRTEVIKGSTASQTTTVTSDAPLTLTTEASPNTNSAPIPTNSSAPPAPWRKK